MCDSIKMLCNTYLTDILTVYWIVIKSVLEKYSEYYNPIY